MSKLGVRTSRRLGAALGRRPVGLPLSLLGSGIVLLVFAVLASPGKVDPPGGSEVSRPLLYVVSLLFAVGGALVVAGVAGLVSAALVHIVKRTGR